MEEQKKKRIWIKEAIERYNVDVSTIAERMNTTTQNVYYLIREGGTQTKISSLMALADAIGMDDLREFFTPPEEIAARTKKRL